MSLPALSDTAIVSHSPSVLASEMDGQVVLVNTTTGVFFSLNEVGGDIWRATEASCSVGQLVDRLAIIYDADRETIAMDLQAFLARLAAKDVVRIG
jgi:hypothetical protein